MSDESCLSYCRSDESLDLETELFSIDKNLFIGSISCDDQH